MSKRVKIYLVALFALLALAGLGWVFFARANTAALARRAKFDADHAEPARRAEVLIRGSIALPGATPEPAPLALPAAQAHIAQPAAPGRPRVDILNEINRLLSSPHHEENNLELLEQGLYHHDFQLSTTGTIKNPEELWPVDLGAVKQECLEDIANSSPSRLEGLNDPKFWNNKMEFNAVRIKGISLTERLDRLDHLFLDCDWVVPEFKKHAPVLYGGFGITRLHQLAVLRALALGDAGRAERLFLKGIEFYKIHYYFDFPNGDFDFDDFPYTIALMGEMPQFPTHGFEEARRIMETVRFTPSQRTELRQAHAQRWVEQMSEGQVRRFSQTDNWLHWMQVKNISPDTLLLKGFWPRLHQALIDYAAAWEVGDHAGMRRIITSAQTYGRLANIPPGNLKWDLKSIETENPNISADPDLIRLELALALYRRATGGVPASRAELIPRYLSPSPADEAGEAWTMRRLEAFERPITEGVKLKEPDHAFVYSVRPYRTFKLAPPAKDGVQQVHNEVYGSELPDAPDWDDEAEEQFLMRGYHPAGTYNKAEIVICPVHLEAWEPLMEDFRRAARERGITIKNAATAKISSNQTSTTALKR